MVRPSISKQNIQDIKSTYHTARSTQNQSYKWWKKRMVSTRKYNLDGQVVIGNNLNGPYIIKTKFNTVSIFSKS